MKGAQQNLLIALEMRRDGLDYIASRIRSALGDSGDVADQAINQIAGQMQVFLASDVIYASRVMPFIRNALNANEIGGQTVAGSQFMPNQAWLQPDYGRQRARPAAHERRAATRAAADRPRPARHRPAVDRLQRRDAAARRARTA